LTGATQLVDLTVHHSEKKKGLQPGIPLDSPLEFGELGKEAGKTLGYEDGKFTY
jgi:hypothetical protein